MGKKSLALLMLALPAWGLLSSCVSRDSYLRTYNALRNTEKALEESKRYIQEVERDRDQLKNKLAKAQALLGDAKAIQARKAELDALVARLKKSLGGVGELGPNVEVIQGKEGVSLSIQGEVLFASGKAELSPEGKATLRRVARVLKREGFRVRIAGHTDTDPIRKSHWRSNLDLSANRAVSVAEFLAKCGVPRRRMEVAGYGEFRPRVPGNTPEAKRRNRRVEILILGKE